MMGKRAACVAEPDDSRQKEAGFTLIEVLAALSIFSIAALGLIHVSSENVRTVRIIETQSFAAMVADNIIVETLAQRAALEVGVTSGRVTLGGRDWEWRRIVNKTGNPLLLQITLEVSAYEEQRPGADRHVDVSLTAFRGVG